MPRRYARRCTRCRRRTHHPAQICLQCRSKNPYDEHHDGEPR
jgi:uncharacterized OB-fold protein